MSSKKYLPGPESYRELRETGPWAYICSRGSFGGLFIGGSFCASMWFSLYLEGILRLKMSDFAPVNEGFASENVVPEGMSGTMWRK